MKVLGEEPAKNFVSQYRAGNGQMQPCYALPKRESELMVMSESYKVQAAIYDRMTELESTKVISPVNYADMAVQAKLALEAFGYEASRELMSEFVLNTYGFDFEKVLPVLTDKSSEKGNLGDVYDIKRNSVPELARMLKIGEFSINHVLYMEDYVDVSGIPTRKAFGYYDNVGGKLYWSLSLVMRLLKAENYNI